MTVTTKQEVAPKMKRYTPFEPAKVDGFNARGAGHRIGSAAVA